MPKITIESDKPVVVIPVEEYDSLRETIEILSDPDLVKDIDEARKALREGRTVSWDKFKKDFLESGAD